MDIFLIIAAPTLIGLFVLWKIFRLNPEPIEERVRTLYVCPNCRNQFTTLEGIRGCDCGVNGCRPVLSSPVGIQSGVPSPVFGYEQSPFSPELIREMDNLHRIGNAQRVIVCEGPISQAQLEALREELNEGLHAHMDKMLVEHRRLEV